MPISILVRNELAVALNVAIDDIERGSVRPYDRFKCLASYAGVLIAQGNVFTINGVAARALTSVWANGGSAAKLLELLIIVGLAHRHGICDLRPFVVEELLHAVPERDPRGAPPERASTLERATKK